MSELSTGSGDNDLATDALREHAEAMRQATVARLVAERYAFPRWFSSPPPDMNDTETKQARRRRLMALDFEALADAIEETA